MSQYTAYLDRMNERLAQFGRTVDAMKRQDIADRRALDFAAAIDVQRNRLHEMRRRAAELTPEAVQSFTAAVDSLGARIGQGAQKAA